MEISPTRCRRPQPLKQAPSEELVEPPTEAAAKAAKSEPVQAGGGPVRALGTLPEKQSDVTVGMGRDAQWAIHVAISQTNSPKAGT